MKAACVRDVIVPYMCARRLVVRTIVCVPLIIHLFLAFYLLHGAIYFVCHPELLVELRFL